MKLKNEDIPEIINLYHQGLSSNKIAEIYNVASTTIKRLLLKNNVPARKPSEYLKKFPAEKEAEIILYYQNGNSIIKTAEYFKCSQEVIKRILKQHNISVVPAKVYSKKLTSTQQKNILELYKKGLTTEQIAKKYKVRRRTISTVLKENNVKTRTTSKLTSEDKENILTLYKKGATIKQISLEMQTAYSHISKILTESGLHSPVRRKSTSSKIPLFTQSKICDLYKEGLSIEKLSENYSLSPPTIRKILKLNNIQVRHQGFNAKERKFSEQEIKEIINLYTNGYSIAQIAKEFNTTRTVIAYRLKKNNVVIRIPAYYIKLLDSKQESEIISLYAQYPNMAHLARKYNVSVSVIRRILNKKKP